MSNKKKDREKLLEEFRNNIFCRRESNQKKAKKLWEELKPYLNNSDIQIFNTEWSHYLMGDCELDINGFSLFFYKHVKDKLNGK